MSDLQCPARLYVARPASEAEATSFAESVRAEHVTARVDLRGRAPDLQQVADVHRGEGVLVLVDVAPTALPGLAVGEVLLCEVDSDGVRVVGSDVGEL